MKRFAGKRVRVVVLAMLLVTFMIAGLAGPSGQAAGPAGCQTASGPFSAASCSFKTKTGVVELVGAGEAFAAWTYQPYYFECSYDNVGAESTLCYFTPKTTINIAVIGGFVAARDVILSL